MGGVCSVCEKKCMFKNAFYCGVLECQNRAHGRCVKAASVEKGRWFCEKCRPIPGPAPGPALGSTPEEEPAGAEAAVAEEEVAEEVVEDSNIIKLGDSLSTVYDCACQICADGFWRNDSLKEITMSACIDSLDKYRAAVEEFHNLENHETLLRDKLDELEWENYELKVKVAQLEDACKQLEAAQTIVCSCIDDSLDENQSKRKKN